MGATSSLCSGSKSVQVVNSTERRPERLPGGDLASNDARVPPVADRRSVELGNNARPVLTESEEKWIQQTNNNSTGYDGCSRKAQPSANEGETVDRRQYSNSRRKDEGCNLSVYDNLPGSLGKHGVWGEGLGTEGSSVRYSAYKSRDGPGGPEYVDGYLVNQNTDLNFSDTSLLGSESCDSWHMGRKAINTGQGSSSSSLTSIQNPSLDNGNRSDPASVEANSKNSSASNGFSRNRKSVSKESLTNKDYDNLPPLGELRPSQSDSGNLSVIGEAKEGDIRNSLENGRDNRPSRIASAKCERVSSKANVASLRQAKSLTLPLTTRSRPKSARKRDLSANREHLEEGAQCRFSDAESCDSDEDEMLSIPDETRGAGENSDDLSDGLSGLGSSPDLTLEAFDAFPDSLAPTPQVPKEPRAPQPRPPSFDIKSVLDDKGKSNIGKKGSERSISSIVITPAGDGKETTEAKIRALPPDTSLEEVGAMIAGDIIFRRSQGSMTQAEYQGIVKAYRIILEQLLAYQSAKDDRTSPKATALETIGEKTPNHEQKGGAPKASDSPRRETDSSSDLEEKLDQVTEVFELEFAQKLVERGNVLTEADITKYLTEHAQNVKSIKTVLKTQKVTKKVDNEEAMAALPPQQQRRLAMLDEVARLLFMYSTDITSINSDDIDQLCEAILESISDSPQEELDTVEKEVSAFGKQVDNAMLEMNDHFMQTVSYKRNEATAEELSQIIEQHLIEETATIKRHESERVKTINQNLSTLGKTKEGFHVKVPELDSRPDDMNKKRRKLEQALKRILLGRKPIGEEEISDILDKYRREQRVLIEERDTLRLKRRDELKKKLVIPQSSKPANARKDILKEMQKKYEETMKSKKQDKVSAAIHTMTAQKILDSSSDLSKDRLAGLIKEHQRRVSELENIRKREREKPVETDMDVVARDKAEDEKRNKERRIALNRATDVKQRAEDVLASYRDATLLQHSIRPVHLPKSPNSQSHESHRNRRRHENEDAVPDSGYVDGMSVGSTSVTPSLMTGTPISSPGGDYGYLNNRPLPRKTDDAESVKAEDYETLELLVNDVVDHCVDDYSRAENLYSWLVSQEIPATSGSATDGESPLFALSCIAKGQSSYADVFLEMTRLAGLTCEKIEGFTKTPDFSPGEDIFSDLYRHSWNAVFIDNRYFLLDASEGSRREKFFREHFFCTGPSIFALTHFPGNQRWQLMERLVTEDDFASALKVWPAMFVYDIRPLNSKSLIRTYDGKMCITFSVKNHSVLCHLEYAGPGPEVDPRGLAYHVDQHTNNVDNEESFHLTLPQEGVYFFTLLVNDPEDEFDLPVCQYRIDYQDELL